LAIKDIGTARRVVAELRTKLELNGNSLRHVWMARPQRLQSEHWQRV